MRVQLGDLAGRVFVVVRYVGLDLAVHGCAGRLFAPEDAFLFLQRGTVPALDQVADHAHHLIAAVGSPGRFVATGLHPDQPVHGLGVIGVGVGRAVTKTQEVARALGRLPGLEGRLRRYGAFLLPAHEQQVREVFHHIAQGVDIGVSCVRAELQADVTMAKPCFQAIVGKADHLAETLGLEGRQAKAVVEQRIAHGDRDCQVVRVDHRAKDA